MLLAAVASLVAGAISVVPANACPTAAAISDELKRVGALSALTQVGRAEVEATGTNLHIVIRDQQGLVLGSRKVDAPLDCAARAALAAVLIAAWTGDWIKTNLGAASVPATDGRPTTTRDTSARTSSTGLAKAIPSRNPPNAAQPTAGGQPPEVAPTPPPPVFAASLPPPVVAAARPRLSERLPAPAAARALSSVAADVSVAAKSPWRRAAGEPLQLELSALGFGIHDGDAGGLGGGLQAALLWRTLSVLALADYAAERQRALGPGDAAYGFLRLGAGAGAHRRWRRVFVELALVPEVVRYALAGRGDLAAPRSVAVWTVMVEGRGRLAVSFGRVSPFLYVGASWSMLSERLRLDDTSDSVTLSRLNLAAGLGISVAFR